MKKKILILITTVFFIIGMILLNRLLNDKNKVAKSKEKSTIEVIKVTSANFDEEVLNSDKTVLIDFYTDWCGPCKMLSPVLESVVEENQDLKVVKIDVDIEQDLAIKYQVMSIPTIVVIKNGQEVNRSVGVVNKSQIVEMVK